MSFVKSVFFLLLIGPIAAFSSQGEWSARMQSLLVAFQNLAPYVYSPSSFENPANRSKVEAEIASFAKLAKGVHGQSAGDGAMGKDPSLKVIAGRLETDASEALSAFRSGNFSYSRYKLARVSRDCFQCHSRNTSGPEFKDFNLKLHEATLKPSELADIYVATRQFDRAIEVLQKTVASPEAAANERFEYQRSVRNFLALAIRVKQDPKMAMSIVDQIAANTGAPEYLKEDASYWRRSIERWQKETSRAPKPSLEKAKKLIAEGKASQEYPLDGHADVAYLRASAVLHELLDTTKASDKLAEAMYHLGRSYEVLSDIGQWFLQDSYFESCIRTAPKSKIAARCYRRYELSQLMGYSGSSGLNLPDSERERLKELRALAFGN